MCLAANTPSTMAQQKAATTPKLMNTTAATSWKQKGELSPPLGASSSARPLRPRPTTPPPLCATGSGWRAGLVDRELPVLGPSTRRADKEGTFQGTSMLPLPAGSNAASKTPHVPHTRQGLTHECCRRMESAAYRTHTCWQDTPHLGDATVSLPSHCLHPLTSPRAQPVLSPRALPTRGKSQAVGGGGRTQVSGGGSERCWEERWGEMGTSLTAGVLCVLGRQAPPPSQLHSRSVLAAALPRPAFSAPPHPHSGNASTGWNNPRRPDRNSARPAHALRTLETRRAGAQS